MTNSYKFCLRYLVAIVALGSLAFVGFVGLKRLQRPRPERRVGMHGKDAEVAKHVNVAAYLRSLVSAETVKVRETRASFPLLSAETLRMVPLLRKPYPTLTDWKQVFGEPVRKDGEYYVWTTQTAEMRTTSKHSKDYELAAAFTEDGTLRQFRVTGGVIRVSDGCGEVEVIGRTKRDWYCAD